MPDGSPGPSYHLAPAGMGEYIGVARNEIENKHKHKQTIEALQKWTVQRVGSEHG